MKKTAAALLCAAALLLCGCGNRVQPAATPAPTAAPTAEPTPTAAPAPTPEPTPEPTATPEPTPFWTELEKGETYLLFTGNTLGGKALGAWLMSGGASLTESFVCDKVDGPLFTLTFTPREEKDIPAAGEEARYIRLSTDATVLESGLLETLLPAFESRYGYIVEICTGSADDVSDWAGVKSTDVALLSQSGSKKLSHKGFSDVTAWAVAGYALRPWTPDQPETGGE